MLSSGFLAFAAHSGFLKAIEEVSIETCHVFELRIHVLISCNALWQSKVPVASIVGTSSGAISGSLYAAGYSAEQVTATCKFYLIDLSHFPADTY